MSEFTKADLQKMVDTYKVATSGPVTPHTIYCTAGLARSQGAKIDASIPDGTIIVITDRGCEVLR
jgi:hypothetical protein